MEDKLKKDKLKKAGVIGFPISHSRSPILHGFWLEYYNIKGSYDAIEIAPENLYQSLKELGDSGYQGVNITLPHKETSYELCKKHGKLSKSAAAIGAVNTLSFTKSKGLYGDNTDAYGFIENLKQSQKNWQPKNTKALILGAGGAARAVIYALINEGVTDITISNRTEEKAKKLAQEFSVKTIIWQQKEKQLKNTNLLINCTSLGMKGQAALEISLKNLPKESLVYDLIYTPLETHLLLEAKKLGHKTIDGLGMLLWQAAPAFEKWFGQKPQITDELRKAVLPPTQKKPLLLGVTGSIGMGKTTITNLLAEMGCPTQNADKIVHDIYDGKIDGGKEILKQFPESANNGQNNNIIIDRQKLSKIIESAPEKLKILEDIIHPIVNKARHNFIKENQDSKMPLVFDIPLLFETGLDKKMDKVITVTAPKELQRKRVLSRPNMTEEKFETLLKHQMPDAEKCSRADYIINTDSKLTAAKKALKSILKDVMLLS